MEGPLVSPCVGESFPTCSMTCSRKPAGWCSVTFFGMLLNVVPTPIQMHYWCGRITRPPPPPPPQCLCPNPQNLWICQPAVCPSSEPFSPVIRKCEEQCRKFHWCWASKDQTLRCICELSRYITFKPESASPYFLHSKFLTDTFPVMWIYETGLSSRPSECLCPLSLAILPWLLEPSRNRSLWWEVS